MKTNKIFHTYTLQLNNENDGQSGKEYKSLSTFLFILWIKSIFKRRWFKYELHKHSTVRILCNHYKHKKKKLIDFKPKHPKRRKRHSEEIHGYSHI